MSWASFLTNEKKAELAIEQWGKEMGESLGYLHGELLPRFCSTDETGTVLTALPK